MTKQELLADGLERVSHAARRLGLNRNTLYDWIKARRIPYLQIRHFYRIPTRAINDILENGLHFAEEEPPKKGRKR